MTSYRLTRRDLLRQGAALSVGFLGMRRLLAARPSWDDAVSPFGELLPDPQGVMNLPHGFSYRVFSKVGERMNDGFFVPALHDGMAAFPGPDGLTVLIRNHEVPAHPQRAGAFGWSNELFDRIDPAMVYDLGGGTRPALGGTTTLVYDTRSQTLKTHFLSLAGTLVNCAGGPTPWNSWITCEETETQAGSGYDRDHGYNFEVPVRTTPGLAKPVPLAAMGRFKHEAVAVDPRTGFVYQTEDQHEGLIYRFMPTTPGDLHAGRLQAMAVRDAPSLDSRNWPDDDGVLTRRVSVGQRRAVEWIDLEDIDSPDNDLRFRGHASGAVRFARGEGMWFGENSVYFACTNGGPHWKGQIWRYHPSAQEGHPGERDDPGYLELFLESDADDLLTNCDNLTLAPWGDLLVCEDSAEADRLIGITPHGEQYLLAENVISKSELAGICFSPDGSTLFVNIQHQGLTLAITGPWRR